MQAAQGTRLEPLRPVEAFLDAHVDKPDGVVKTAARRGRRTRSRRWVSTRRIKTGGLAAKIARVAAVDLPNIRELEPLRMPRRSCSVSNLAASAADLARTAEPYADVFTAAGLPTDFIAQLTAPTDATRNAISEGTSSRRRRSGATGASSRGYRPAARSCTSSTCSCGACSRTIPHCSGTRTSSSAYRDPRAVRHRPHRLRRRHLGKRHPRQCRRFSPPGPTHRDRLRHRRPAHLRYTSSGTHGAFVLDCAAPTSVGTQALCTPRPESSETRVCDPMRCGPSALFAGESLR
jgi:hypothetical protein